MFGFEASLDVEKKLPHLELPAPAEESGREAPNPAVQQSIGEIQQHVGGRAAAQEVETPEAKAAEGGGAAANAMVGLAAHGPAAMIAPIAQSVAEIKQTVAETQQAAPAEEKAQDGGGAPAGNAVAPVQPVAAPAGDMKVADSTVSINGPAQNDAPAPAHPADMKEAASTVSINGPAQADDGGAKPAAPVEDRWAAANGYNRRHPTTVRAFLDASGGACLGADGGVDAAQVAQWQGEHGLAADGMVGPLTAAAAKKGPAPADSEAAPIVAEAAGHAPAANGPAHANAPAANGPAHAHAPAANGPAHANAPAANGPAHANAPAQAAEPAPAPAEQQQGAADAAGPAPDLLPKLLAQAQGLLREFASGLLDKAAAVEKLLAYDRKLHGGVASLDVMAMIPAFLDQLLAAVPAVAPAPANAPANGPAQEGSAPAGNAAPPVVQAPGEPFKAVVDGGSDEVGFQKCLVFASPGGVTATPDIFLFFHGHDAQYGIDEKQEKKKGVISGADVAGEAMTHARGKNVIAILPQGVVGKRGEGGRKHEGGYMKGLQAGLPAFLGSILSQVAAGLGHDALAPGHISIAGHSAGGYQGVHDAMRGADELADQITDLTLMDSSYADAHFADAAKWIFAGSAGKSLRIIGSPKQIEGKAGGHHGQFFGKGALGAAAKKHGMEVRHLDAGEERENKTRVKQHSQLVKDGQVHADILILVAHRGHHDIRDDVMDDAILSIGEGAEGADQFAKARPAGVEAGAEGGEHEQQQPGGAGADHQPVTVEDLGNVVSEVVPSGGGGAAQGPAQLAPDEDPVEKAPTDGLVQPALEQRVGGLDDAQADAPATEKDPAKVAWMHDTADATSVFPDKLKKLYDNCVDLAKAGKLMFPAEKKVEGKTWAPFVKFRSALYDHFGYGERRINMEITDKSSKSTAFRIKDYIHSVLSEPLAPEYLAPGEKGTRIHKDAAAAFATMHEAAKADGVDLLILSGFREPKNKVSKNKYAVASNSSHSYGLAIDLKLSVDQDPDKKGDEFHVKETTTGDAKNLMKYYKSSVLKWMMLNGAKFNFFPYQNEPWHYEYNPEGMADQIIAGAKAFKK